MKFDTSLLQRSTDKFVVHAREFSSRGTSFMIVILGVLLQASHTTLLMYNVAAFESNFLKGLVSLGIGIFISMALAIFTLKHDGRNQKIESLINIFFYFEVFTNLFYYFNSILLAKGLDNLSLNDYIFFAAALPFAYIMPYAIKQFAGVIAADRSVDFGTIDIVPVEKPENDDEMTASQYQELIQYVDEKINSILAETGNPADNSELLKAYESYVDSKIEKIQSSSQVVDTDKIVSEAAEKAINSFDAKMKKNFQDLKDALDQRYVQKNNRIIMKGNESTLVENQ